MHIADVQTALVDVPAAQGYLALQGSDSTANDYEDGNGTRVHSQYHRYNAGVALGWTPDDDTLVDLFNIVRFPKSNITHCGRIIETLCDHYFPGTTFGDVLTGLSGTRAQWIIAQYRQGPVAHS